MKPLSYAFSIATMPISDRMESFLVHNIFAFLFIVVLSERYGEREYFRIGFSCLWLFFFFPNVFGMGVHAKSSLDKIKQKRIKKVTVKYENE